MMNKSRNSVVESWSSWSCSNGVNGEVMKLLKFLISVFFIFFLRISVELMDLISNFLEPDCCINLSQLVCMFVLEEVCKMIYFFPILLFYCLIFYQHFLYL